MERFLAVLNPAAGGGRCGKLAPPAIARLRAEGLTVEVEETRAAGDGVRIAREAFARGVRNFIAIGGDGTGFEIVNGVFPAALAPDQRVRLGFLPLGTGNSFLRDFTSDGAEHSLRALKEGRRRPCDVVRVTHRDGVLYYINIFSFGFVADVATLTNRRFKPLGALGYVMGVVCTVAGLSQRPFAMTADGAALPVDPQTFVSINNSRYTGGSMMMAPRADTGDGMADLICVGKMGRWELLRTFPRIFKGTHLTHPAVRFAQVRVIDFALPERLDVMVDGEVLRIAPTRLEVLPAAFDVCV